MQALCPADDPHPARGMHSVPLVLAWGTILAEALFPLLLLAPPAVLGSVLAGFFVFHLAAAVFMGLNTYPWAFLAAYPATVAVSGMLRTAVWG